MSDELKTPYTIETEPFRKDPSEKAYLLYNGDDRHVAIAYDGLDGKELADIARALNCHDKLVEALDRLILQILNSGREIHTSDCHRQSIGKCTCGANGVFEEARDALKLAKGGSHD